MFYTNLIFFLVAIFTFSTNTPPQVPRFSGIVTVLVLTALLWGFFLLSRRIYSGESKSSSRYFSVERKLIIIAVVLFVFLVYGLDIKFYLQPFSLGGKLPILENAAGLSLFFFLLGIVWVNARDRYQALFQRKYSAAGFVLYNIKVNLPVVIPWLALSFIFDILILLPFPKIKRLLLSPWGDVVLFGVFVFFLVLFFPPLVRRLWNCRPIPEGALLEKIRSFCSGQGFHSQILYWPLFEGQVLTAGIMGIVPGFRYLLLTPALLEVLDEQELESVLAHEIGHVKKKHLILYIVLFLGFSLVAGALATPIPHFILAGETYYYLLERFDTSPETLLGILGAVPLLLLLLIYFRFIFGFFIRNFERQADAFVFSAMNTGTPLVSSFEKIALLSGGNRDEKNWHHFGIGERIDFLERCEQDRALVRRHDRKVHLGLGVYFLCVALLVLFIQQVDLRKLSEGYEEKYAEAVLLQKIRQEPSNSLWLILLGDFLQSKQMEKKAVDAYERALELRPTSVEVNNNLAWLLLTAGDGSLRDPQRALTLARTAALLREEGFVLDTLATAFWANGLVEEALATEARAARLDSKNRQFYLEQMEKFKTTKWGADSDIVEEVLE